MPLTPNPPFPKGQGDVIRSGDWNDLANEVIALDGRKVNRAGDAITGSLTISSTLAVGTTAPQAPLHILGGNSDLTTTEGDLKIGNTTQRLKIGVALGGASAGDAHIQAQGGTNRLLLGG